MDPSRRLTLQLVLALAFPAAAVATVINRLFPPGAGQGSPAEAVGAALLVLLAAVALTWSLLAPVRAGLAPAADDEARRHGALAALRLPSRASFIVLAFSAAAIAAVAGRRLASGGPLDLVAAGASAAVAFGLMAAMIARSVLAAGLAPLIVALGPADPPARTTLRQEVLLVATGLLAFALLLVGPVAYARYRSDLDRQELAHVSRALRQAEALWVGRGPAEAADFAFRASAAPTALLGPGGAVLAQAGEAPAGLLRKAEGPEVEPIPGGWRVRRSLAGGASLVAFVVEAQLVAQRRAFWADNAALGLLVLVASALLVWLVARSLGTPVRELARATAQVASGDLRIHPPTVSIDEAGHLAADFRRMVDGLATLVHGVREANRVVGAGARELELIGARVRDGAAQGREQVMGVQESVEAMQESVGKAGRGMEGLTGTLIATGETVGRMTAALDLVRHQSGELARLAESSGKDVESLSQAGRRAQSEMLALCELADHAGGSLGAVKGSLDRLESAAVGSQLAAAQAAELAERSGGVVREAAEGIEGVRAAVADAKQRVTVLGRRSDDIVQVLTFIGEVAGRTNLLSLNASIIATQAGEHGKAFAVVAEQIRELAAQISRSTRSIGDIIRAVRDDVEGTARLIDRGNGLAAEGVALAARSLAALDELKLATVKGHESAADIQLTVQAHGESTREVANLVAAVAAHSRALVETAELVGRSVGGLGSVTRAVHGLADRVAGALEDQSAEGHRQREALSRLDVMLAEVGQAIERHGRVTAEVREALGRLTGTAQQHEGAVEALSGVAGRLGSHARTLGDRLDRFQVRDP